MKNNKIAWINIELSHASEMWDMGNPEAMTRFENHLKSANF